MENDSAYVNHVYGSKIEEFLKSEYSLYSKINDVEIYKLNNNP
jgi:hypothetical protein